MKMTLRTLFFCAALVTLWACNDAPTATTTEETTTSAEAAVYYCPMKCEGDKTYDQPGKCPVCNMDLVQKVAEQHTDEHEGHQH